LIRLSLSIFKRPSSIGKPASLFEFVFRLLEIRPSPPPRI
jgi:hypothetical protein